MKFTHTGLFIPEGISPDNISETRKYSFNSTGKLRTGNRADELKTSAVKNGFIDGQSLRKYWILALGESEVIGEWNNLDVLKKSISEINGVESTNFQEDKTKKSLVIDLGSEADETSVKKAVKSKYGSNSPVYVGYTHLEFVLSYKWLSSSNQFLFNDVSQLW